ncbi:MAG: DHA2 family efflux MFS transporter permease subunit [Alphaproteobacteria bacterium]
MSQNSEALAARYGPAYKWFVTLTAILGTIATILSATIVNVAIPDIMGAFGIGQGKVQWLATAFLASMTASMLLTHWLVEVFGQRMTYVASMAIFVGGSALGGVSPNADILILSRALQGFAAGAVQPLAMLAIFQVFPAAERGKAMGIFGIGVILAPAIGPFIGGLAVDAFDWRWVFFLAVPFCIIGSVLALFFLPTRVPKDKNPDFDWLGFIFLAVFLASLLTALSNGQKEGWDSAMIGVLLAIAVCASTGFIIWETMAPHPLLDLRLFLNRQFAAAAIISFVFGAGIFGSTYLIPLFVQTIQGYTPTRSGLLLMPGGLMLGVIFPIAGRLSDRIAPHWPIVIGLSLFGYGSYLMARVDVNTSFWLFSWWILVGRVGLGILMPPLMTGGLRALPQHQLSQGSGAMNFTRQLGGAFGVNLLVVALERRRAFHTDAFSAMQTSANSATVELLQQVRGILAQAGLSDAAQLPMAVGYLGRIIVAQASALAFRDGFLIVAGIFMLAIIPALMMRPAASAK